MYVIHVIQFYSNASWWRLPDRMLRTVIIIIFFIIIIIIPLHLWRSSRFKTDFFFHVQFFTYNSNIRTVDTFVTFGPCTIFCVAFVTVFLNSFLSAFHDVRLFISQQQQTKIKIDIMMEFFFVLKSTKGRYFSRLWTFLSLTLFICLIKHGTTLLYHS